METQNIIPLYSSAATLQQVYVCMSSIVGHIKYLELAHTIGPEHNWPQDIIPLYRSEASI